MSGWLKSTSEGFSPVSEQGDAVSGDQAARGDGIRKKLASGRRHDAGRLRVWSR